VDQDLGSRPNQARREREKVIWNAREKTSRFDLTCLIACLLFALAFRILVILNQTNQLTVDRDAYLGIATSVAEGRGYSSPDSTTPTAFRPPLYPLTLAFGFIWFSTAFVVANVNLLAGLLTVALTASLGKHLGLGRLRFVAAMLVAVDPLLLQYTPQPMTECFCTFLTVLWLRLVTPTRESAHPADFTAPDRPTWRLLGTIVGGIAFGLLVLSRPTFWVIVGFLGLKWLIDWRCSNTTNGTTRTLLFQHGVLSAAGTLVTVAPWVLRNWLLFGVPILTTTHGGYTLLLGNNPTFYDQVVRQPWGTIWPEVSQQQWTQDLESQMKDQLGPNATEIQRDAFQSQRAKKYIISEPWHTARASLHRIRSLWNTSPQGDTGAHVNRLAISAVGWFYTVELTAGFAGMMLVLGRRDRSRWLPLWILIVSVQLVHLFYWTNTRMRAPLTPTIALFAVAMLRRSAPGDAV
jgi:hypothetical protein